MFSYIFLFTLVQLSLLSTIVVDIVYLVKKAFLENFPKNVANHRTEYKKEPIATNLTCS